MNEPQAVAAFAAIGQENRLRIVRALVTAGPDGLAAGVLAGEVGVSVTNLSFHLKALTQAGMLTVEAEGRFQRYRANIPLMLDLIAYLTEECCSGHPEQCGDMRAASKCSDAVLPPLSSTQEALKK